MKTYKESLFVVICLLGFACNSEKSNEDKEAEVVKEEVSTRKISFSAFIDSTKLSSENYENDFKIRYVSVNQSDTIEYYAKNGFLEIPISNDFSYFEIDYKGCKSRFDGGDFLEYQGKAMVTKKVSSWKFIFSSKAIHTDNPNLEGKWNIIIFNCEEQSPCGDFVWTCEE